MPSELRFHWQQMWCSPAPSDWLFYGSTFLYVGFMYIFWVPCEGSWRVLLQRSRVPDTLYFFYSQLHFKNIEHHRWVGHVELHARLKRLFSGLLCYPLIQIRMCACIHTLYLLIRDTQTYVTHNTVLRIFLYSSFTVRAGCSAEPSGLDRLFRAPQRIQAHSMSQTSADAVFSRLGRAS